MADSIRRLRESGLSLLFKRELHNGEKVCLVFVDSVSDQVLNVLSDAGQPGATNCRPGPFQRAPYTRTNIA